MSILKVFYPWNPALRVHLQVKDVEFGPGGEHSALAGVSVQRSEGLGLEGDVSHNQHVAIRSVPQVGVVRSVIFFGAPSPTATITVDL